LALDSGVRPPRLAVFDERSETRPMKIRVSAIPGPEKRRLKLADLM